MKERLDKPILEVSCSSEVPLSAIKAEEGNVQAHPAVLTSMQTYETTETRRAMPVPDVKMATREVRCDQSII
jgi:hypothetical protein